MSLRSNSTKQAYVPTLDGWRAIAISGVITCHSYFYFEGRHPEESFLYFVTSYLRLGVDLFFAISGFIICHLLLRELNSNGGISLKRFYIRRAFRILPPLCCYLGMLWLLSHFAAVPCSSDSIIASLLFYVNYEDFSNSIYTGHLWSLCVEEHFYLFWPVFLALVGARRALWITPILALVIHAWRSADAHFNIFIHLWPHAQGNLHRTDTRIDALLWGCFAALICFQRRLVFPSWVPFFILLVIVGSSLLHIPALPLVYAVSFPLLIVSTIFNPGGALSRFLELPLLRFVGGISYSLYIWQQIFLFSEDIPDPAWLKFLKIFPLNFVCIIICSIVSRYLIEKPMIQLGRRFSTTIR